MKHDQSDEKGYIIFFELFWCNVQSMQCELCTQPT